MVDLLLLAILVVAAAGKVVSWCCATTRTKEVEALLRQAALEVPSKVPALTDLTVQQAL
jgi:hypothetical protein